MTQRSLIVDGQQFGDSLAGQTVYLLGAGPSIERYDLRALDGPTMSIHYLPKCGFEPDYFVCLAWGLKGEHHEEKERRVLALEHSYRFTLEEHVRRGTVPDHPKYFGFRSMADGANPDTFLTSDRVDIGDYVTEEYIGVRATMLCCLKLLHWMGTRDVVMLGVDFTEEGHFPADHFTLLREKLERLKPAFDKAGFHVWNANPDSNLKVFPVREI